MLLDILDEHLEEAEILWLRRRTAVWSHDLDLGDLEALEKRLIAHLEGLALGAEESRGDLEAAQRSRDADAAFVAAATLVMTRKPGLSQGVVSGLGASAPEARQGAIEALCFLPLSAETRSALEIRLDRTAGLDPSAIEILGFHGCLSPASLGAAVLGKNPETRRAAASAIGRIGGEPEWIGWLVADDNQSVRDLALQAAARRGLPGALARLHVICGDPAQVSADALRLLACFGDRSDIEVLKICACRRELGEVAIAGLATLGYAECVEALMEVVDDSNVARASGGAFTRITGLLAPVIADEYLDQETEDATFEDLRPVPDARATRALWRERATGFAPPIRWRNGEPLATERWKSEPHHGDLLTRREELTRLWTLEPELFQTLELNAPAARQRAVTR